MECCPVDQFAVIFLTKATPNCDLLTVYTHPNLTINN